mgnify:CR=1 FL=1
MPAALPMALRVRFREYVGEGLSGRAAAARLKLSAATGVRWLRRLREQGDIRPDDNTCSRSDRSRPYLPARHGSG